jgi:hypothetical protein
LENVVVCWYGELTLEILKKIPIKSISIKAHLNISIMYPLGIEILINIKENHFKRTLILTLQKFITTIWLRSKKDFTLNFIISLFNPFLLPINNLEYNSI